jgi:hypothetical protein
MNRQFYLFLLGPKGFIQNLGGVGSVQSGRKVADRTVLEEGFTYQVWEYEDDERVEVHEL